MSDYESMMAKLQDMSAKVQSGEVQSEVQVKSMDEALSGQAIEDSKPAEVVAEPEIKEEAEASSNERSEGFSSVEEEAMLQGWTPKAQFRGNPKDYVDAQTFLDRGDFRLIEARKLRSELSDMSKKNEELTSLVKGLVDDIRDAEERGKQKKLQELAEQKRIARESNDLLIYEAIQEEEKKLVKPKEEAVVNPHKEVIEAYNRACQKAPWFEQRNTDPVAAARWNEAEAEVQSKLLKANPKASYDDQFNFAIDYIAAKYPSWGAVRTAAKEVDEPEVSKGSKTISGSTVSTKSYGSKDKPRKLQVKDLSPTQQDIYNKVKKNPDLGVTPEKLLEMWSEQQRG